MKKVLLFITSCLIVTAAFAQGSGSVNGIRYSWGNGRATVEKQSESIQNLTANIPETIKDYTDGGSVHIVDSIVDEAFKGSNLMYLTMPNTILKLNSACFYGCTKLQNATIPSNLLSIGDKCFYNCVNLRSINFPTTLEVIGDSCFSGCSYYSEVKLGEAIKSIGKGGFSGCKYIPSIKIYGRIDSLKECTFYGCSTLSSFRWPKEIKYIGRGCFARCSSLQDIHIPSSIATLADSCFANCSSLSKVFCLWNNLDNINASEDAFKDIPTSTVLYVPKGCIDIYKNKSPWNKFSIIEEYEFTDTSKVESIDLGLGVKWATCNVGVSTPYDYGDKLSWGEIYPKQYYNWNTYIYCKNGNWYGGMIYIGSDISETEYDVAHEMWGGNWRMPTNEEAEDLINNCKWEWTSYNGTSGMKVTGYNGNSIFLPSNNNNSVTGTYWTSTQGEYSHSAIALNFDNTKNLYLGGSANKYLGMFVRPVTQQDSNRKYISIEVCGSGIATFGAIDILNGKKWFNVEDNYNSVLTFHPNTNEWVTKLFVNNEDVTQSIIDGQYTINHNSDSTFVKVEYSNSVAPADAIDLGLSVLWANCNLGADSPEDAGKGYSWGAVQSVPNSNWNDYICSEYECGGSYDPIYAAGYFDSKDIAGSEFDQAHVLLGSGWQLPSNEQFQELIDKCDWSRTSINGTNGFKITGANGNSIFLPDNGYGKPGGVGYYDYNGGGYYWSSTIVTTTNGGTLHFMAPDSKYLTSNIRCYTQHIRPVFKQTEPITGITENNIEENDDIVSYYNVDGTHIERPSHGIYIIRTSKGVCRKIIIR